MPLPTPNPGEKEQDFIPRCMGNETMNKDYPDNKQRSAVCYSQWRNKKEVVEVGNEGEKMLAMEDGEYAPLGGAQSFEELDKIEDQREKLVEMSIATSKAEGLMTNVIRDPNMSIEEKPGAIQKIMSGLVKRIKKLTSMKATDLLEESSNLKAFVNWDSEVSIMDVSKQLSDLQAGKYEGSIDDIAEAIEKCDGNEYQKKNLRTRLNRIKELAEAKEIPEVKSSFWITKDKEGNMRWVGFPSNKWRDRDNPPQIISEEAHKEFVEYLERTKDFPVLLSWHTPGTRIGQADWAQYEKGFLIMGGPIDKDKHIDAEKLAVKCQKEAIGMSHGFVYSYADKEKEIIGKYRTWEVSHLPLSKAANVWTSIELIRKEVKETMLSEEKKAYLVGLHGQDVVDQILNKAADLEKDLLSAGIEFKDVVEPEVKETDPKEVVEATAKAIVESEGFKSMLATVAGIEETVKDLKETIIPGLEQKITDVEQKAQKSQDDIIADAMKSRSSVYQASQQGPAPTEQENKEGIGPESESLPYDPNMMQALTGVVDPSAQTILAQ